MDSVVGPVIDKALDAVMRKVESGKKLTTEDLVVLMLGMFRETNRRVDTLFEKLNKRIDVLENEINGRFNAYDEKIALLDKRLMISLQSLTARSTRDSLY